MSYDLIVIGGGPAGYWAARRASDENLRTLLIEKKSNSLQLPRWFLIKIFFSKIE